MGGGNNNTVLIRDSLGFLVVCNYYKKTICGNYINNIFYYFLISIMLKTNISKNSGYKLRFEQPENKDGYYGDTFQFACEKLWWLRHRGEYKTNVIEESK